MTGCATSGSHVVNPIHLGQLNTILHVASDVNSNGFSFIAHATFILGKHKNGTACLINLYGFHLITTLDVDFAFTLFILFACSYGKRVLASGQSTGACGGNPTFCCFCYFQLIVDVCLYFHFDGATFL